MFNPFANLEGPVPSYLVELLSIGNKAALKKFSRKIEITEHDFAVLVWNAASIGYFHAIQHYDFQPDHLQPTDRELAALREGSEKMRGERQKFFRKINQIFQQRRLLVSHILYNRSRWHLFYFDQRDTDDRKSHWKYGSHIHFVNDLWPDYNPANLWDLFSRAEASAGGKLHLRFRHTEPAENAGPLPLG